MHECLIYDVDQYGNICIHLAKFNMSYKLRPRDDSRVESHEFNAETLTLTANLRPVKNRKKNKKKQSKQDPNEKSIEHSQEKDENPQEPAQKLVFRVFDKVKVKVETTDEFPLDVKCSLLFTKEDLELYDEAIKDQDNNAL